MEDWKGGWYKGKLYSVSRGSESLEQPGSASSEHDVIILTELCKLGQEHAEAANDKTAMTRHNKHERAYGKNGIS